MTETAAAVQSIPAPQGMKAFFIIWGGQLISMLGSGLTNFGLAVWIYAKTGQATPFALTVLFGNLPQILLLPFAGSLADRWNRRRIMILADTGNALTSLAILLLLAGPGLEVWHIYAIAAIGSVFSAFQEPAYMASVTMLVPKKNLGRANGMLQTSSALSTIITPLLAGVLFVAIGLQGILLIDFITFFFAIGALLVVHIPQPELVTAEGKERKSLFSDAVFGWRYLRQRPGIFGLLWYYAMVNFLLNWSGVLMGPMILSTNPPSTLGAVQTALGVGALVGSLVIGIWGGPKRRIPAVIIFITFAMVGMIISGIQPHPFFAGAGLFLLMFNIPIASANSQAVFQAKIPQDLQGRVFAIRSMISRSVMPLAYITAGPLADLLLEPLMAPGGGLANTFLGALLGTGAGRGIGLLFVLSGLIGIVVSLLVYANPRIRLVEDELPDAIPDSE